MIPGGLTQQKTHQLLAFRTIASVAVTNLGHVDTARGFERIIEVTDPGTMIVSSRGVNWRMCGNDRYGQVLDLQNLRLRRNGKGLVFCSRPTFYWELCPTQGGDA